MHSDLAVMKLLDRNLISLDFSEVSYNRLIEQITDEKEIVLIGEATHGTHEFYYSRAEITKKLIKEKGFNAVAIEGDWPDVYQLHQYIKYRSDGSAKAILNIFKRFPIWMWRNEVVADFLIWLRDYNGRADKSAYLFGLDLYCLHASIEAVTSYLKEFDPSAAKRAQERYSCLYRGVFNPKDNMSAVNTNRLCTEQIIKQLVELQQKANFYLSDSDSVADDYFNVLQNAQLIKDAQEYYRATMESNVSSWNVRDEHMFKTLLNIKNYLETRLEKPAKIIVWAHNSHVGNASATEFTSYGETNLGEMVKKEFANKSYIIGYSTYSGSVTAASVWGGAEEVKDLQPALENSYEALFHKLNNNFMLLLHNNPELFQHLSHTRLQRAVGVIYLPETERMSHYFYTQLSRQFDAICHYDKTTALKPLTDAIYSSTN